MEMRELVNLLNKAAKAYYSGSDNIMTDKEYDALYDKLVQLEKEKGTVFPDSPTQRVGYAPVSGLEKFTHPVPALSLDKTKEPEDIRKWMGISKMNGCAVLMPKLDGLTAVAYYRDGSLERLVTRGDGHIGEDVTHNAPFIDGVPLVIDYKKDLIVRGEVLISYKNFEKINEKLISEGKEPYQNPRNLASGSLRLLDPKEAAKRHLVFKAFNVANPYIRESEGILETVPGCFKFLDNLGINTVEYTVANKDTLEGSIEKATEFCKQYDFPTDGLVFTFYNIDRSLGTTGKFPKHSMAFKWADETKTTTIHNIVWSPSKTGLINPVAVFDPVELEGTVVQRASVHNLKILENLDLRPGDTVTVYKANMIIPQIDENLSAKGRDDGIHPTVPTHCPVCGKETVTKTGKNGSRFLYCENPDCAAKHLGKFERLVDREALNIVGLSTSILEQFLSLGFLHEPADIFHLDNYKDQIISLDGFGQKSYENLIKAAEKARKTTFRRFFYSLGIPGAGRDVAKILNEYFESNAEYARLHVRKSVQLPLFIMEDLYDTLDELNGIGQTLADAMVTWFGKKQNFEEYQKLLHELDISDDLVEEKAQTDLPLKDTVFVITGSLNRYENRNALKAEIESLGGKVSGSVSKKTNYLINNDSTSSSSKNKKAQSLGVSIITEEEFLAMIN